MTGGGDLNNLVFEVKSVTLKVADIMISFNGSLRCQQKQTKVKM